MKRALPWVLLAVGVVIGILAVVLGTKTVVDAFQPMASWVSPTPREVTLTQGDWMVYERVATVPYGSSHRTASTEHSVSWEDVTVTGPGGPVPVTCAYCSGNETLTFNNSSFLAIARFRAPSDGTYSVTVSTTGADMLIGPPLGTTIARTFGYVGLLILGILLTLAAIIWLIVAFVIGRSRQRPAPVAMAQAPPPQMYSAGPPGQWYPDPDDPTQWRWWNGSAWTDERRPRG